MRGCARLIIWVGVILVSKTYWGGMPFWFRRPPEHARQESVVLRTHDQRQVRALYWTSEHAASTPKIGVVVIHPRIDFHHHYSVPRLVEAGFAVLAANTRHVGNDTMAEHEEMVLDVAACVRWLREKRGVEKVVLLGNSGGGSLVAYYQAEARKAPGDRAARTPAGSPTRFDSAVMTPADAMVYVAAHRGQGKILLDAIDPSVFDERNPLSTEPSLDMYDTRNGFVEPPAWSSYSADFLERYRAAQVERVRRLDTLARSHVARHDEAAEESEAQGFATRPFEERQDVLKRRACEPIMVVYRTMADPAYVDIGIDASERDYGSLLSERPDLMNMAALGFARTVTPRAWLSTWSGLSSSADLVANVAHISEPTLIVHAERDREVRPSDATGLFEACASKDKKLSIIKGARHYFEPEVPGERETPHVEAAMDQIVPWIRERLA
jgi:alpha-beta hydrolase superfamily lysophospholipase